MPVLTSELRRQLENVIINARDQAESAAASALRKSGVDAAKPHEHFGPEQKAFRNRVRARGRQAGDNREANGVQEIIQLTQELAYEYWHRMLFARFLAENHLLMHPDGVAVSLSDCNELAAAEGLANGYMVAAKYASRMLPQIFRTDDVLLEIEFPANDRIPLEKLLASLPAQTFTADDSLGWVYQFWQSKRKNEVNAKGDKIDARSISAVTQLFTEHYMVLFLLHNTIGAWHAGKVLAGNPTLAESAASENELRKAVALDTAGGYTFDYLRFVRGADGADGPWRPAAGTFTGWPRSAAELKMLDPCCGSGHFLVAGFELQVRLRMAEESLDLAAAIDAVLRDNLHGLELDARCTQIAAFNLAMAAWKVGGYRRLPPLNIACTGIGPQGKKEGWLTLADDIPLRDRGPIKLGLDALYETFRDAPTLGSLIDPTQVRPVGAADFETLSPTLASALKAETKDDGNGAFDHRADAVTAQGLLKAAELLVGPEQGYTLAATNVPYLGSNKQSEQLQQYLLKEFPSGKADLAAAFLLRIKSLLGRAGTAAVVTPQNWITLSSFKRLRQSLLEESSVNVVATLGPSAFRDMNWWAANTLLVIFSASQPSPNAVVAGFDVSDVRDTEGKPHGLQNAHCFATTQLQQRANPDHRIVVRPLSSSTFMADVADFGKGSVSGDAPHYVRCFWEISERSAGYRWWLDSPTGTAMWSGRQHMALWDSQEYPVHEERGFAERGQRVWGRSGVAISKMNHFHCTLYDGELFDDNCVVLAPKEHDGLARLWAFCASPAFKKAVREVEATVAVTAGTFVKIPYSLSAAEPPALEEPNSPDPTQWLFHGRPENSDSPFQVAVARVVGYRWPAELDEKLRLSDRARGLVKRCDDLLKFADDDGIVPIPGMRQEKPLAERVTELLAAAYGKEWSPAVLQKLLADAGMSAGASLDDWLRDAFFEHHCKRFNHRPFIWHIWDGRKDGFNVLVNYHRLDHKRLQSLTHAYLGDWISTQRADAKTGVTGADLRLQAAEALQSKLEKILDGEKPYDIFVRWKPLKGQPIGWHPDLNDGVRMNIRPFVEADVLRKTPNIKWTKDRGKDPETAPWFKVFNGERINDHHLSLADKLKAREV